MTISIQAGKDGVLPPTALVVEENALLAETIADGLGRLVSTPVASVTSISAALDVIETQDVQMAVVDTSVRGQSTEVVLNLLDATDIPHVVASFDGCIRLPGHAPYLQKPFSFYQLKAAVAQAREQAAVRSWNRVH
jgi:DNA-binding NtrC family response regulator